MPISFHATFTFAGLISPYLNMFINFLEIDDFHVPIIKLVIYKNAGFSDF